jgi:hypothetical protein
MSGFSEQQVGQYIVSRDPVSDLSQLSGRVSLFNEDGTPFGAGGGSSQRAYYGFESQSFSASVVNLRFSAPTDGSHYDALLDLSDPASPKPVSDGVYCVVAALSMAAVAGKHMVGILTLDGNNDYVQMTQTISIDSTVAGNWPSLTIGGTYFVPEGSPIRVQAGHDVDTAQNISGRVSVVKLG